MIHNKISIGCQMRDVNRALTTRASCMWHQTGDHAITDVYSLNSLSADAHARSHFLHSHFVADIRQNQDKHFSFLNRCGLYLVVESTIPRCPYGILIMNIGLLNLLRNLLIRGRQPWTTIVRLLGRVIDRLLSNPQIAELWRFIFLGTVVEAGRIAGQKVVEAVSSCTSVHVLL
jgi:hypothetical protein